MPIPQSAYGQSQYVRGIRETSLPAAERTRKVPVGQFPLQGRSPSFTIRSISAVEDSPVEPVDIRSCASLGCITTTDDEL